MTVASLTGAAAGSGTRAGQSNLSGARRPRAGSGWLAVAPEATVATTTESGELGVQGKGTGAESARGGIGVWGPCLAEAGADTGGTVAV